MTKTKSIQVIAIFLVAAAGAAAAEPVKAVFSDTYTIRVDAPPEAIWAHIKHLYVDGERRRQAGMEVAPITDDPTAWMGGQRAYVRSESGEIMNESRTRFSIIDDEDMFLAMHISGEFTGDASATTGGIYVTHDVRPVGDHGEWQVIMHTYLDVEIEEDETVSRGLVHDKMSAYLAQHRSEVAEILEAEKALIEAQQ